MKHFEAQIQAVDQVSLYVQGWEDRVDPRAVICLVHGLGEHSGRYENLAKALVVAGYSLVAFDLRGHGRSEGLRGHIPAFEAYMQDIGRFLEEASRLYPGRQRFLYGHSLGGLLAANYALRHQPAIAGLVLTGPALKTSLEEQKMKVALAKLAGKVVPKMSIPSGLDVNSLCHDAEVIQAYVEDPLVHDRITLGWSSEMLAQTGYVFEHSDDLKVPVLIMHGTEDHVCMLVGSQQFADQVGDRCTLRLWEGMYHEIHNEPEHELVFDYLIEWLDQHVPDPNRSNPMDRAAAG